MLIASGANIDEVDSEIVVDRASCTAASYYGGAVDLLLDYGADPKHVSPYGDTVPMADARDGSVDFDWKLSGNVNAQNRDGVTALMLLASRGGPDEIKTALKAGADVTLRDNAGHIALDYVEGSICYRTLVRGETYFMQIGYDQCPPIKGDAAKSRKLLQNAMKRKH